MNTPAVNLVEIFFYYYCEFVKKSPVLQGAQHRRNVNQAVCIQLRFSNRFPGRRSEQGLRTPKERCRSDNQALNARTYYGQLHSQQQGYQSIGCIFRYVVPADRHCFGQCNLRRFQVPLCIPGEVAHSTFQGEGTPYADQLPCG